MTASSKSEREEWIRRYKTILKEVVDRRPSGVRQKIAERIGKNKSFVSQITNPNYKTPVPERHLEFIFETARFSAPEREKFLDCYRRAHPRAHPSAQATAEDFRVLHVRMPRLGSKAAETELDRLVQDFARRMGNMLKSKG